MANPSAQAVAAIRAHITDWSQTNAQILSVLNAPVLANPVSQPTLPAPVLSADIINAISSASLAKCTRNTSFPGMHADILAGNRPQMLQWAQLFTKCGDITVSELTAITNLLNATMGDPAWKAQVSWSALNIGRQLDLDDIATARAAGGS